MRKNVRKVISTVLTAAIVISGITLSQAATEQEASAATSDYQLVWSDEFNGTALDTTNNWNIEVNGNGGGNNELQYYTDRSSNIKVSDGMLQITAHKESYNSKSYTSGRITTQYKQTFKYGKIEARMKLPSFAGAWPAFWMLGANFNTVGWPKCGEIDIMEAINQNNTVYSTLHWSYQNSQADTSSDGYNVADRTAWHTYGFEWTEKKMKFYCDDVVYQTYDITTSSEMEEFREKAFIIFNLAIGGNWPGFTIDQSVWSDETKTTMYVDWVRVYQTEDQISGTGTEKPYTGKYVDVTEDAMQLSTTGSWKAAYASDAAGTSQTYSSAADGITMNISAIGKDIWSSKAYLEEIPFYKNQTYTFNCTINSDQRKMVKIKIMGETDDYVLYEKFILVQAGVPYEFSTSFKIPSDYDSNVNVYMGFGKTTGDSLSETKGANVTVNNVKFTTSGSVREDQYLEHGNKPVEVNTTEPATTTQSQVKKIQAAKTTISKVAAKKKTSNKLKITLKKKITLAKGYEVRVFTSKSNAKSNKKVLVKAFAKNLKTFTIKNKKLKNKKNLFVKARAYAKINGKKVYAKTWSNIVKVKVK